MKSLDNFLASFWKIRVFFVISYQINVRKLVYVRLDWKNFSNRVGSSLIRNLKILKFWFIIKFQMFVFLFSCFFKFILLHERSRTSFGVKQKWTLFHKTGIWIMLNRKWFPEMLSLVIPFHFEFAFFISAFANLAI